MVMNERVVTYQLVGTSTVFEVKSSFCIVRMMSLDRPSYVRTIR